MKIIPLVTQTILWLITRPLFLMFVRAKTYGKEGLKKAPRNAILAVNHVSQLDPIMVLVTLGPWSHLMPVFSVSQQKEFYKKIGLFARFFYGGVLFRALGAHPIHVGAGNYELSLKTHITILEKGGTVGIFPEGKRTIDGTVGEARPGVAYLLWRTGVPVVPVALHGHYDMTAKSFFTRKRTISVHYGKPIYREELFPHNLENNPPSKEQFKAAAQVIMGRIREMHEAKEIHKKT